MLNRSRAGRALGAAAATILCTLGAGAGPAGAAEGDVAVPAGAPTVAGPSASGATLIAFAQGRLLCVVVRRAGAPRPTRLRESGAPSIPDTPTGQDTDTDTATGACSDPPTLPAFGLYELGVSQLDERTALDFGVAGLDAVAVEARRGGAALAHAATSPSPLPGALADLRFWMLERPGDPPADALATLDAAGTVRRAVDLLEPVGRDAATGTVIQRGRRGGARWTLRTFLAHPLAPTPLQPERRATVACLSFGVVNGNGTGGGGDRRCDDEALAAQPILVLPGTECGPTGLDITVLARPAVRRVVAVLGDGSRRTVALRAVPGVAAGTRAGALVLGTGVALRRVVAVGAGGRTLQTAEQGVAPAPGSASPCLGASGAISIYSVGLGRERLGRGPHAPHVVDDADGVRVCVAIDRAPGRDGCGLPPSDPGWTYLHAQPTADGRYVFGLVPAEVVSARLKLDDGTARTVAAEPVPGYTGRYAAVLHAVAADVPGPHRVIGFTLLDARGRALNDVDGAPEVWPPEHVTTILRTPGLPPLRAGLTADVGALDGFPCLALGPLRERADCAGAQTGLISLRLRALCSPHRLLLYGLLRHATDRLVVRTRSGHTITGRTRALPAAIAGARHGLSAVLVVIAATETIRDVRLHGRAAGHLALPFPPAADQCGYAAFPGFFSAFSG